MLCLASSRELGPVTAAAVRAKMLVTDELQGPFSVTSGRQVAPERLSAGKSHVFLVGVIDIAGLFVP